MYWVYDNIISPLTTFISFVADSPNYPTYIKCTGENCMVDFYFRISDITNKKNLKPHSAISLSQIGNRIGNTLNQWYNKNNKYKVVLDLFFAHIYRGPSYQIIDFLLLAQALETYHVRFSNEKDRYISKSEFKKLRKSILDNLPEDLPNDLRESIEDKINFANTYILDTRLRELIDRYWENYLSNYFGDLIKDDFITKVRNTRNYYTHYSASLEKKAWQELELYYPTKRIELIVYLIILDEIGLLSEDIFNIIKRRENIDYLRFV